MMSVSAESDRATNPNRPDSASHLIQSHPVVLFKSAVAGETVKIPAIRTVNSLAVE